MECQICKAKADCHPICDFKGIRVCESCVWDLQKSLEEWPRKYVNTSPLEVHCSRCFRTTMHDLSVEYQCKSCGKDIFFTGEKEEF